MKLTKKNWQLILLIMLCSTNLIFSDDISPYLSDKKFKTGIIRFHNREYEAAINIFNNSLSIYPPNNKARYYLGLSYLQAGYIKNTIEEWENIIKFGGGNYLLKQKLNDLYFRMAIDKQYDFSIPYVFTGYFAKNLSQKIKKSSFIFYDEKLDSFLISSSKRKYVVEFDANGNVIREIGRKIGDFSQFEMPTGIYIYNNTLFVADYKKDYIFVFDREGKYLRKIGGHGYSSSNISGPMGIYIKDDYIFVVDNGNDRVQKYTLSGEWVQSIGEGELLRPTDICGKDNLIYISDTQNSRIVVYDLFGNFVSSIGKDELKQPRGLYLKGDKLYISDAKEGLFIYDLNKEMFEKMNIAKEKLDLPFGVCVDSKNIVYQTDFNTARIAVFTPLQLQYANLNVYVSQIWTSSYPKNFLHIRVWDRTGKPVYNLKEENFLVYEEGTLVPIVKLGATYEFRKNMYVKFIIDKSIYMKEYEDDLIECFKTFLEKTTGKDWLDIKVLSKDIEVSGRIKSSVLWPIDFYKKQDFSDTLEKFDIALHDSIRELLNVNRNKAIVIFTAGKLNENSFSTYDPDIIINYAKNNGIPVYIVNFTDENSEILKLIATETFGKYYSLKDLKEILNLYDTIKNSLPLEYILSYEGLNLKGLKSYFVNVRVKVNYKGLTGIDEVGYYVPEFFIPLRFFGKKEEIEF